LIKLKTSKIDQSVRDVDVSMAKVPATKTTGHGFGDEKSFVPPGCDFAVSPRPRAQPKLSYGKTCKEAWGPPKDN